MFGQFFKRRVGLRPGCAHMGVKPADELRRIRVKFRVFPEPVKTGVGQFIGFARESRFVQAQIVREEIVQRLLARIIRGVFKYFRAKILGETHDLKEMAVAIASQRGNAHAGENFAQPGIDGHAGFFHAARFKEFRKLIRKIWNDGAGASRHKQRHVMGVKTCADSTISGTSHKPSRTIAFHTAAVASSAGSGARSASIARSERRRRPGRPLPLRGVVES